MKRRKVDVQGDKPVRYDSGDRTKQAALKEHSVPL